MGDIDVDSEARLALLAKSFSDVYKTSFLLRKKRKTLRAHAFLLELTFLFPYDIIKKTTVKENEHEQNHYT